MSRPIKEILSLMDLTDLSRAPEPEKRMQVLGMRISTPVAGVCVYPEEIPLIKACLDKEQRSIKIVTVANFPRGHDPLPQVEAQIKAGISAGAHEIDVVLPYERFIRGEPADLQYIKTFLTHCRALTQGLCLKVIIESGCLTISQVKKATEVVSESGADFVKTSTGKVAIGATLEAVWAILAVLKARQEQAQHCPGIKISGGVNKHNVSLFLDAIEAVMGKDWVSQDHVRIGASHLIDTLI